MTVKLQPIGEPPPGRTSWGNLSRHFCLPQPKTLKTKRLKKLVFTASLLDVKHLKGLGNVQMSCDGFLSDFRPPPPHDAFNQLLPHVPKIEQEKLLFSHYKIYLTVLERFEQTLPLPEASYI